MKNTFGSALALTIFGESHGRAIGGVLDGMAAGVPVDEEFIAACMDKRRARGDGLSTPRVEADNVQLLSGVVNGHTTGTAIALMIENQNTRSGDYAKTADLLRPGHADYTAYAKYHGFQDARGGGHFSGRITAALVAGGAIVLGVLVPAALAVLSVTNAAEVPVVLGAWIVWVLAVITFLIGLQYLREALERQQLLGAMEESDVRTLLTRRVKGARSRIALSAAAVSASISSALAASLAQYDAEHASEETEDEEDTK